MTMTGLHEPPDRRSVLEPAPDPDAIGDETSLHPLRAALVVVAIGYVTLTAMMIGIGLLLTHALAGSVGHWDLHVNRWFVARRSTGWNDITRGATDLASTLPVIAMAAVAVAFLWWRHHVREAAFLAIALVLEVTVFLTTAFVVSRPRPAVPHLDSAPPTSSFPSGHTAAATVLFAGLAIIIACCTRARLARLLSALVAVVIAVGVGMGRVYRGMHNPTDVLAGALLGVASLVTAAIAVRTASRRIELRDTRRTGQPDKAAAPERVSHQTIAS